MRFLLTNLLSLTGCALEAPPEQMEELRVELISSSLEDGGQGLAMTGALKVMTDGRDSLLLIEGEHEAMEIALHLPGESDLRTLDGRLVTAELSAAAWAFDDRGLALYDEAGLAFVARSTWHGALEAEQLGEGLVDYGEPVHREKRDGYTWTYTTARFETDAGAVELLPGEVGALALRERPWRAVVNAAYQVEEGGIFSTYCLGPGDQISFEILRLEEAPEDLPYLAPAATRQMTAGCGG